MKRKIWLAIFLGLIVFLFVLANFKQTEKAKLIDNKENKELIKLVKVIDGDTIKVKIGDKTESVRLIGIDAPEMEEESNKKAIESKKYLEDLLLNKKIRLEADETQNDRDIYNRLLRYIFLEDGTFINKKMIEANMANEYTYKVPYKYQVEFKKISN